MFDLVVNQLVVPFCQQFVGLQLVELLVFVVNVIAYVRYRCDDVHVEFAVQAFLYDFHVQESEKSASETESKCYG